ncbi:MAG: L,D-transpeptidase family protein [Hyphomicrobium sp.]
MRHRSLFRMMAAIAFAAIANPIVPVSGVRQAIAQTADASTSVQDLLKSTFESADIGPMRPADRSVLAAYYQAREYRPVWVDSQGPTRAAQMVLNELNDAESWGLTASDFTLTANRVPKTEGRWTPEQTVAAELEISQAVITYAVQAAGGRIAEPDRMLSTYLDRRPMLPNPADALASIAASDRPDALLLSYHPQRPQFQKLREAYAALSAAASNKPEAIVPKTGDLILPGDAHPDVRALRVRLNMPSTGDNATAYDAQLVAAVKRFQQTAGLVADGYVGTKTRRALNSGDDAKLETIRANMEEWRWMPSDLGKSYVFVNIPAFTVELVHNGAVTLSERVIVGKNDTQTPIFSKAMSTIVLRPEWHLPDSIKLEKLLSAQRRGIHLESQGYLIRKGKRIVQSWRIDWSKANLSNYEIFQPSGDGNALGDVKFLFPNKHSVYLHDTPSKSLFETNERLYSHGCIRVQNPLALAQTLLDADKGAKRYDVKDLVRRGPGANDIALETELPVHIAYFTAWAGDDGVVRIYPDYYGHEQRIKLALENKWQQIDKGEDHLAAVDTLQLKTVRIVQRKPKVSRKVTSLGTFPPVYAEPKGKSGSSFFKYGGGSSSSKRDSSVGELIRWGLSAR